MTVVTTTPAIEEKKQKQGERVVAEDEIIVPPAPAGDEIDIVDPSSKAGVVEVATEAESHFPSVCYCPITKRIMVDPVVGPSGTSFERDAVLEQQNDGELISYYPNRALRAYIEILHQMNDDEGSVRGTLRKLDTNIRTNWDRFVEKAQLPLGQSRPLPDGKMNTLLVGNKLQYIAGLLAMIKFLTLTLLQFLYSFRILLHTYLGSSSRTSN